MALQENLNSKIFPDFSTHILFLLNYEQIIQCVPLATEPSISLIILPLMRTLQRNLKRTYLIV